MSIRALKRQEDRELKRIQNEIKCMSGKALEQIKILVTEECVKVILATVALVLNADYRFGKERISRVINGVFGQLEAVNDKIIDPAQIIRECEKIGLDIEFKNGRKLQ